VDDDTSKQGDYRPIYLMNIDENTVNKIMANQIKQHIRNIIYHELVGLVPGMQG
jgi:hypothetical protein